MRNKSLIGSKLANFEIQRLVGRGGMADVYHGIDVKLHRPVAIKIFDVATRSKSTQPARFMQEARMMAKWRHENIIQIYYAGDETGLFYYVMEYIDGYDLASIISVYKERGELIPIDDVLRIGDSLASALDYAHKQGVIHRDVKPANVMIAEQDGRVVLGDFGLALDLTEKSQGEVFGSPHYIAPEQARRSSDAVPQSDLYALGVILYELLTGVTPFNDPNPASLALQHITEEPPLPRNVNPSIPVQVEKVLLKALEKSPQDRYQSGKKLMDALRKALKADPIKPQAVPPTLPPIPVNAPTIRRSNVSLNSFTHTQDVKVALDKKIKATRPQVDFSLPEKSNKRKTRWVIIPLVLLLIALLGVFAFRPQLFGMQSPFTMATVTIIQEKPVIEAVATGTSTPVPTVSPTIVLPTHTSTNTVTPTETSMPTNTVTVTATTSKASTNTPIGGLTVITSTPVPTQTGYLMTAYYNNSSFYIHNKGNASRSVSGFVFERIRKDGVTQQRFEGWRWEENFNVIQANRCVALKIYKSPIPYLDPTECEYKTLSTLHLHTDSGEVFWVPDDNSDLFRILWLGKEIARCEIEAGTCDFYVP